MTGVDGELPLRIATAIVAGETASGRRPASGIDQATNKALGRAETGHFRSRDASSMKCGFFCRLLNLPYLISLLQQRRRD